MPITSPYASTSRDASELPSEVQELVHTLLEYKKAVVGTPDEWTKATEDFVKKRTGRVYKIIKRTKKEDISLFAWLRFRILENEKTNGKLSAPERSHPNVQNAIKRAFELKKEFIEKSESLSIEHRIPLNILYMDSVYASIRDLLSIFWENDAIEIRNKKLLERLSLSIDDKTDEIIEQYKANGLEVVSSRLILSPMVTLQRDVNTALTAPTQKNYMRALKLMTLHMLMSQIHLYKVFLGDESATSIPNSCQTKLGGNLPPTLNFEIPEKDVQIKLMETLLVKNGFIAGTEEYREYYLDYIEADPLLGGFTGLLPFEKMSNARRDLSEDRYISLDDISYFENIFQYVIQKVQRQASRNIEDLTDDQQVKFEKVIEKILTLSHDPLVIGEGADKKTLDTIGLSNYTLELIKNTNKETWRNVTKQSTQKRLKNQKIRIPFPDISSSDSWKRFAMGVIAEYITLNKTTPNSKYKKALRSACSKNKVKSICGNSRRIDIQNIASKLANRVKKFTTNENDYLPKSQVFTEDVNELFPILKTIWLSLSLEQELPKSIISEWDFLNSQLDSYNPWAALRLSYIHFMQTEKDSDLKEAITNSLSPMGLNQPLRPFWGDIILNKEEKRKILEDYIKKSDEDNQFLFRTKNISKRKTYEELFDLLVQKNLFQREDVHFVLREIDPNNNAIKLRDELDSKWNEHYQNREILFEIYKNRNDLDAQIELVTMLEAQYGDYLGEEDIKIMFLELETELKAPIYRHLLKDAAKTRMYEIKGKLDYLCNLNTDDQDSFREFYYQTLVAQEKINKAFEIDVPNSVSDRIGDMNDADWKALKWSLGSAALFIGATVLGSGCVIMSGGLCAPITSAALATLATTTQLYVFDIELDHIYDSKERSRRIENMYDLGITKSEGIDEVRRSYFWAGLEVAFTIPLLGYMAKGIQIAGKTVLPKAINILKRGRNARYAPSATIAGREVEILQAKYLLGMKKLSKTSFSDELLNQTIVQESVEKIDKAYADQLVQAFKSPRDFKNYISGFSDKRLLKAQTKLTKYNQYTEELTELPVVQRAWVSWRRDSISKYVKQEKKLTRLIDELESLENTPQALEAFLKANVENIATLITALPLKKRHIPYYLLAQGSPALSGYKSIVGRPTRGIIVKRLTSARNTLVFESIREQARATLKLPKGLQEHTSYETYRSFRDSMMQLIAKNGDNSSSELTENLAKLEMKLANRILKKIEARPQFRELRDLSPKEMRDLLFIPKDIVEYTKAEAIWNSIPADELYKIPGIAETAQRVVSKLNNYGNLSEFQRFFSALKILSYTKNPQILAI